MAAGDHLFVECFAGPIPFQHHGVDLGDGTVVHFTNGQGGIAGPNGDANQFQVQLTSMDAFTDHGRRRIHTQRHSSRLTAELACQRARMAVGKKGYHLLWNNCEHFAKWCVCGEEDSDQVSIAVARTTSFASKAVVISGARLLARSVSKQASASAARIGVKQISKAGSPWLLLADAAQFAAEAAGHHVGLESPEQRRRAGQIAGGATALGIGGVLAAPAGMVVGGMAIGAAVWAGGEVAGEVSRRAFRKVTKQRTENESSLKEKI